MFASNEVGSIGSRHECVKGCRSKSRAPRVAILLIVALSLSCGHAERVAPELGTPPQLVWSPPLAYPPQMFEAGIEGSVTLQALVDTTGRVEPSSIEVVRSSRPAFERPAKEMLRNSRFQPGSSGGRLLRTQVRVPIIFDIQREGSIAESDSSAAAELASQGERLVRDGNIDEALSAYAEAQGLDSRLNGSVGFWYGLCWHGSLWGYAADVIFACDQAVALAPKEARTRKARGVARALTADYAGAIEDLEASAAGAAAAEDRTQGLAWVVTLRSGSNPFTPEVLAQLRGHS